MKNIKQTHGAFISDEDSLLDEIFNIKENKKTAKASKSHYDLESLSLSELQDMAREIGIVPVDNKKLLIKSLRKELDLT